MYFAIGETFVNIFEFMDLHIGYSPIQTSLVS